MQLHFETLSSSCRPSNRAHGSVSLTLQLIVAARCPSAACASNRSHSHGRKKREARRRSYVLTPLWSRQKSTSSLCNEVMYRIDVHTGWRCASNPRQLDSIGSRFSSTGAEFRGGGAFNSRTTRPKYTGSRWKAPVFSPLKHLRRCWILNNSLRPRRDSGACVFSARIDAYPLCALGLRSHTPIKALRSSKAQLDAEVSLPTKSLVTSFTNLRQRVQALTRTRKLSS